MMDTTRGSDEGGPSEPRASSSASARSSTGSAPLSPQHPIIDALEARFEEHVFSTCLRIMQHLLAPPEPPLPQPQPSSGLLRIWSRRAELAQHLRAVVSHGLPGTARSQTLMRGYNGKIDRAVVTAPDGSQQLRVIKTLYITAKQASAGGVHASLMDVCWGLLTSSAEAERLGLPEAPPSLRAIRSPYVIAYDGVAIRTVAELRQIREPADVPKWSHLLGPGVEVNLLMRHHYSSLSELSRRLHDLHVLQPSFTQRAGLLAGYPLGSRVLDLRVVAKTMWHSWAGLAHLHSLRVLHNDIKPENVLVWHDDGDGQWGVQLSDLGGAGIMNAVGMCTGAWLHTTPFCSAVRRRRLAVDDTRTDMACDLYALGVTWAFTLLGAAFLAESCNLLQHPLDAQPEWQSLAALLGGPSGPVGGSGPSSAEPSTGSVLPGMAGLPPDWVARLNSLERQGSPGQRALSLLGVIAQAVCAEGTELTTAALGAALRPLVEALQDVTDAEALVVLHGGSGLFPFSASQCTEMVEYACGAPGAVASLAAAHTARPVRDALARARRELWPRGVVEREMAFLQARVEQEDAQLDKAEFTFSPSPSVVGPRVSVTGPGVGSSGPVSSPAHTASSYTSSAPLTRAMMTPPGSSSPSSSTTASPWPLVFSPGGASTPLQSLDSYTGYGGGMGVPSGAAGGRRGSQSFSLGSSSSTPAAKGGRDSGGGMTSTASPVPEGDSGGEEDDDDEDVPRLALTLAVAHPGGGAAAPAKPPKAPSAKRTLAMSLYVEADPEEHKEQPQPGPGGEGAAGGDTTGSSAETEVTAPTLMMQRAESGSHGRPGLGGGSSSSPRLPEEPQGPGGASAAGPAPPATIMLGTSTEPPQQPPAPAGPGSRLRTLLMQRCCTGPPTVRQ